MKVAVGSKNPVKINAVTTAFLKLWPDEDWKVVGVSVDSGVPDQPMTDAESIEGATNRAQKALKKVNADYGVGLEGGLQQIGHHWFTSGWMVAVNRAGEVGIGSSARMVVPQDMVQMIKDGKELGDVIDIVFDRENAKQAEGHFGLMTDNHVTRTQGYIQGVIFALSRFLHPEVFEK